MKQFLFLFLMALSAIALAENAQYAIRADGLACPFCAYGIEKKLKAIEGVHHVTVDLERGLVVVTGKGFALKDKQMTGLFNDAGFTFRGMTRMVPEGTP